MDLKFSFFVLKMETPTNVILLYSKYSPHSKRLMDIVTQNEMSFIFPLCVDNQKVRQMVLSSTYNIQCVPCLLVTYASGGMEKYEGPGAFAWIENLLEKVKPPVQQQEQPAPPPQVAQQRPRVTFEENEPKTRKSKGVTNVDDLLALDDEDDDENDQEPDRDPLKGLAPRISNPKINIGEPIDEIDDMEKIDEKVKKAVKNASGGSSIMARAQEMQKLRDRDSEKTRLPIPQTTSAR